MPITSIHELRYICNSFLFRLGRGYKGSCSYILFISFIQRGIMVCHTQTMEKGAFFGVFRLLISYFLSLEISSS